MSGALKARIKGRENTEQCLAMLIENEPTEYVQGVANACEDFAAAIRKAQGKAPVSTLLTMTADQAASFERQPIPFGIHQGTPYGEVERRYLDWVADSAIQLQAYLRFKNSQECQSI